MFSNIFKRMKCENVIIGKPKYIYSESYIQNNRIKNKSLEDFSEVQHVVALGNGFMIKNNI